MDTSNRTAITVEATVNAPVAKVWQYWNEPQHITNWAFASDDWHAPHAENDLRVNGAFKTTMAAKDESMAFDFEGVYTDVEDQKLIAYGMADGRKVSIYFEDNGNHTRITQTFDAEESMPVEVQQSGWQAILNNFKKYVEAN
ncbi:SRPBCC family protein [Pontibacter burrus]|uniref:Polyketide cyclase n=1 Tax=Pontibacter burrus TaxID=2704466 RepID=A0A6B3LNF6_9BACT|nr:SRPBCC family protein [Pontibacter burrus]NEM98442.1 polyketide cyclase [Pontibacter burrus]